MKVLKTEDLIDISNEIGRIGKNMNDVKMEIRDLCKKIPRDNQFFFIYWLVHERSWSQNF